MQTGKERIGRAKRTEPESPQFPPGGRDDFTHADSKTVEALLKRMEVLATLGVLATLQAI
jgi:hypothetical protein